MKRRIDATTREPYILDEISRKNMRIPYINSNTNIYVYKYIRPLMHKYYIYSPPTLLTAHYSLLTAHLGHGDAQLCGQRLGLRIVLRCRG
jgi:hypothetical protein